MARPLAMIAVAAVAIVAVVLGRLRHGSWPELGRASIAPAIFGAGVLCLWAFERGTARPLPRPIAFALLVSLGAAAGALAAQLAPSLGSVRAGVIGGLFWGTIVAIHWVKALRAPRA